MTFYWNPCAVPGTIGLVLGCGLAVFIYAMNPRRLQNRSLALYLISLSLIFGIGTGAMLASDDVPTALGLQAVGLAGLLASTPFYLLFLSTLPTPWMGWLRPIPVRTILWTLPPVLAGLGIANFDRLVGGVIAVPYARFDAYFTNLGTRIFEVQALGTAALGILAAVGAWRAATPGSRARVRARWYAAAFVFWELCQATAFTFLEAAFRFNPPRLDFFTVAVMLVANGFPVFVLLLSYAIFKAQLFDIDLRIKWTLRRGTVAGIFVAVFLVVAQLIQSVATTQLGYLTGAVAAGLLLFALRPLERLAEEVSNKAMPNVQDTDEYRTFRKLDVYRAALHELAEGGFTPKERRALEALQMKLGIERSVANRIEADERPAT